MDGRAASLVVVGASAGGVGGLTELVSGLPADLAAAVGVVLHVLPNADSRLPAILDRAGPLSVAHAGQRQAIETGRIVVAPPDRHLIVRDGCWETVRGPRENGSRPAIDPLFRSAAAEFGDRVVAVVLSGARGDGSAGAAAVARAGGHVVVQDPREAVFPDMPANAIALDHPDRVVPLAGIAPAVAELVAGLSQEVPVSHNDPQNMNLETSFAALDREAIEDSRPPGAPSTFSCPACGGVLWEVDDGLLRFRCRVGHAYSADSVGDAQAESVDAALWAALRALLERAELMERLARRTAKHGSTSASRYDEQAREALEQAELIRTQLLERNGRDT
jgi:two-component system chemotaxis response regulator CheB